MSEREKVEQAVERAKKWIERSSDSFALTHADLRTLIAAAEANAKDAGRPTLADDHARMKAALELISAIDDRKGTHLGRPRFSGIGRGCVGCIAQIALGNWESSTAADFTDALAAMQEPSK